MTMKVLPTNESTLRPTPTTPPNSAELTLLPVSASWAFASRS